VSYVSPNLWGTQSYALMLWQMQVDWQKPKNSTLSGPTPVQVPGFNDLVCGGIRSCVPQPNSAPGLDAISDRLMFRLAYRNLGTHEAMVVNQTVSVGSNNNPPTGVRWYELDTSASGAGDWSLGQAGTYAPSDGSSRWMGSVAMDHHGDMFLGYSVGSSSVAPSIAYTGRQAGDPAGQMTVPEQTLVSGSGEQLGTADRWGDYTAAVVDPSNDCTFWYVDEYYPQTSQVGWATRIGATRFTACKGITTGTLTGTVTSDADGSPVANAHVAINPGDIVAKTDSKGRYHVTLDPGSYTVTAKAYPYAASSGTGVTVSGNQSAQKDISLTPVPKVTVSGTVSDGGTSAGKHGWGLYADVTASVAPYGVVAETHTDPRTGAYSMQLAKGFQYQVNVSSTLNAYNHAYDPASVTLTPAAATTQNVALDVNASCGAPGYARSAGAGFEGSAFPPSGWTVDNAVSGSPVVWKSNTDWKEGNYTGGAGSAAAADSNLAYPYTGTYDTSLVSAPIKVADLGGDLTLHYLANFHPYSGSAALDVGISLDGGQTWTTVQHITSDAGKLYALPGAAESADLAQYIPSGAKQFRLRWRYYDLSSGYDWYAQVDDVGIGKCQPVPGGLVVGQVTNADSGKPVAGAMVVDDLGDAATAYLTPGDPNLKDLFALFAKSGSRTLTASNGSGASVIKTVDVTDGKVARNDMAFGKSDLEVSSVKAQSVKQNALGEVATVTVTNHGPDTAAGVELNTSVTSKLQVEPGATASQGSCTANFPERGVDCALGDIASGGSATVTVKAYGVYAGDATVTAKASEADSDPDKSNNSGNATVKVKSSFQSGGNQGGGGGTLGWPALAALMGLALGGAWLRRRRRV